MKLMLQNRCVTEILMLPAYSRLKKILEGLPGQLSRYTEEEASVKPAVNKWSRKEILGHLVDSAINNQQRFIRMQIDNELTLPKYQQDDWVNVQKYQEIEWKKIIVFWKTYNEHILHILFVMDVNKLNNVANFPGTEKLSLEFLINDYIDHMQHHIDQIVNK